MKGIAFVVAVVVCLIIFGLPILACFMELLCIFFGIGVGVALPVAMVMAVIFVVAGVLSGMKN